MKDELCKIAAAPQNAVDCFHKWHYGWPGLQTGDWPIEARRASIERMQEYVGEFSGKDILELGPNEGEVTYLLESFGPRSITAIECRAINFFKCLTIQNHYGLKRSTFLLGDFEQYLEQTDRKFDIILAAGVLYHMTDPLRLIKALSQRTNHLVLDTITYDRDLLEAATARGDATWTLLPDSVRKATLDGFTCTYYGHDYCMPPDHQKYGFGGKEPGANFMTDVEILAALNHFGFTITHQETEVHPNGSHLWVTASMKNNQPSATPEKNILRKILRK